MLKPKVKQSKSKSKLRGSDSKMVYFDQSVPLLEKRAAEEALKPTGYHVSLQMSVCVRVCESKSTPCQPQTGFLFLLLEKNPLLLCRCGADAKLHFIFRHQSPITLVQCVLMCTLFIHLLLHHHHPLYHLLLLLLTIILKWTV